MAKDWSAERSPTVQAYQNNMARDAGEAREELVATIRKHIATIENTLDDLNGIAPTRNDDDLVSAIRSLGAYQAMLKRQLIIEMATS